MNKQFLRFTFFLLMYLTLPLLATAQVINIPDPNLRTAVEKTLGKASVATITTADMATLTRLEAPNANISDLTGLEHATNLTRLGLGGEIVGSKDVNSNTISDLSPLAGLTNLTSLDLWGNNVSDISTVAGLTNLTSLYLGINNISDISPIADLTNLRNLGMEHNNISDISPVAGLINLTWLNLGTNSILDVSALAGLTQLTTLYLWGNNISDLSPVAGLTNLTRLALSSNPISDISAVTGLTQLTTLYLRGNNISDLSPLVTNAGLGSGDTVDVKDNPLNRASIETHIPALQSRGVTVEFDNRPPPPPINTNGIVRAVYFLPSDRPARPDRVVALRQLIKEAQQFFADEMHRHRFGRKTFTLETGADGEPIVH